MTTKQQVKALEGIANHRLHPLGFRIRILYTLDRRDWERPQSTITRITDGFAQRGPLHHNIADERQSIFSAIRCLCTPI